MRYSAFVLFIAFCVLLHPDSDTVAQRNTESRYGREIGIPLMERYNTGDLPFADVKNFDCIRDHRGMLWLANTYGLLEYDGLRWKYIESDKMKPFFSVTCADDGTIYFGMMGEFGRLALDSAGGWKLDYLSDRLPSSVPPFTFVNSCFPLADDIWFVSDKALFKWNGEKCTYILPRTKFNHAFPAHGSIYVHQDSIGLCRVEGVNVKPVPGGEFFAGPGDKIIFLYTSATGDIVLGNKSHGIFRYDGHRFEQILDYVRDLGSNCIPQCGVELADGSIALGTIRSGIWIVDTTGALITVIDKEAGLPSNAVNHIYSDEEQNLWALLDKGAVRVEWPSSTTIFTSQRGIDGQLPDIVRFKGIVYAATTQGLFRLESAIVDPPGKAYKPARFVPEKYIQTSVYDLLVVENHLLIASKQGVFVKSDGASPQQITPRGARQLLLLSGTTDTVLVGCATGYSLLIREGRNWRERPVLEGLQEFVTNPMCEDGDGRIWASISRPGPRRITRERGILHPETRIFPRTDDEDDFNIIDVQIIHGKPLFVIDNEGDFWLDEETGKFESAEDLRSILRNQFSTGDPRIIRKTPDGRYWTQYFSGLAGYIEMKNDSQYVFTDREKFLPLFDQTVVSIHVDEDGVFWITTYGNRIFRLDPSVKQPRYEKHRTFFREIVVDGKPWYKGTAQILQSDTTYCFKPNTELISFKVATSSITLESDFRYRAMLEGYSSTWYVAGYGYIEYSELPAGDYKLHVQAMLGYQDYGEPLLMSFRIPLPWYRTWWAFLLYALGLGGLAYVGRIWYRSRFLVERSRELETLVKARTDEIQSQAREISRQAEELERLDNIVRTVNRETQLPLVLDALLMQSLLLFPHADIALFVRREMKGEEFRVIAAVGRNAAELKERTFTLRDLVGSAEASLERMREGVYFLHGLGRLYVPANHEDRETHFMAMVIERARLLEGFLVLGSTTEDTFGDSDLRRLMRLKEHASSAIAKAGAIEELEEKNKELDTTNRRLLETQRQLVAHEKLAALGELTAGIAHEIQNPLNFVNNFSELSCELLGELEQSLKERSGDGDPQAERLIEQIRSNCDHIREHGRRATSIVSAMIMHSRSGMSQRGSVVLNDLIDEFAMLSYHGMRLQFPQFTLDLHRDYDDRIGEVEILPQDLSRVIVNICNNAWEAALNRAADEGGDFVPTVHVESKDLGSRVQISIIDNGHGIPEDLRQKIFEPFFTTRRSSRNAGLGLSLSYDIVTQLHGGELTMHSTPGSHTEFRIIIPRTAPK